MTKIIIDLYDFTGIVKINSLVSSINELIIDEECVNEVRIET